MSILASPDARRKYPPLRPLTKDEQQLVLDNLGLARKEAYRIAGAMLRMRCRWPWKPGMREQFYEELIDAAYLGLCVAAQRYNPSSGAKFSTFAHHVIRGAVGSASLEAAVRRGPKTSHQTVMLFSEHGDNADRSGHSEGFDIWDTRSSEPLPSDLSILLSFVLQDRDLAIVRKHIFDDESMTKIGRELGISKTRVGQLYKRALARLRKSRGFMQALEAQLDRRQQEIRARDFLGTNVAMPVA